MKLEDDNLIEIESPKNYNTLTNKEILTGTPIPPIKKLQLFSPEDFEQFVLEWAHGYLEEKYDCVRRCGGAGDLGRDVIGYVNREQDEWDNYQCKHYNHKLRPSDIWTELGKLIYYTYKKEFSIPCNYFFVSTKGVGTKLGDLLDKPNKLRKKLISNWNNYCRTKITKKSNIELEDDLKDYINKFDFSIISSIPNDAFKELKTEICDGVIDICYLPYNDGYERVVKTTQEAKKIQIDSNALINYLHTKDRCGICHHLVNDNKLKWVIKDE